MLDETTLTDEKTQLLEILKSQNELLDCMLFEQQRLHDAVKERNWNTLQECLSNIECYSGQFVQIDEKRIEVVKDNENLNYSAEVAPVLAEVRTKLAKSKIENQALNAYVNATQKFINGVLDKCVPQNRNTLYTSKGLIKKPELQSLVVNRVF